MVISNRGLPPEVNYWPYNLMYRLMGDHECYDVYCTGLSEVIDEFLSKNEKISIYRYYRDMQTIDAIAAEIGVTRHRVDQILSKAINKLRWPNRINRIHAVSRSDVLVLERTIALLKEKCRLLEEENGRPRESTDTLEAEETKDPILEESIEILNLSTRAMKCLLRSDTYTIGNLIQRSEDDLLRLRNMGPKSVEEVSKKLSQYGLHLSQENAKELGAP